MDLRGNSNKMDQQNSSIFEQYENLNVELCFELVFPYLSASDLVSVADSCKQFKSMTEITFYEKYRREWAFIVEPNGNASNQRETHHSNQEFVLDASRCFGLLRCFGHMLFDLKLNYDHSSSSLSSRLNAYVTKYSSSVKQIEFLSNVRRPSAENVIAFLDSCKPIRKLTFTPQSTIDYKKFIQLLNSRQNISIRIDEDCPTLRVICYK